jgi:hypothetical protein
MIPSEWDAPPIVDCLWLRLSSWRGVWHLWEGRFRSPLHMAVVVRGVCSSFRLPLTDLWEEASRPYLARYHISVANRVLLFEYAFLRFVAEVRRIGPHVCVAGSFAAWQLDHRMRTVDADGDAFPRCSRGTSVADGIGRDCVWVPRDVNVFFGGDAARTLPAVERACAAARSTLYGSYRLYGTWFEHSAACEWGSGRGGEGDGLPARLVAHMEEAGFPYAAVCGAAAAAEDAAARAGAERSLHLFQEWRYLGRPDPLFPADVHIVQTSSPSRGIEYEDWVTDGFDVCHCRVCLDVDEEEGKWIFRRDRAAEESLRSRRLRLHSLDADASSVHRLAGRIHRWYRSGFAF